MRVYKDTRFSKDKTPFKTNIGIHFRHMAGKDVHAPGFYVHIEPEDTFVGIGVGAPIRKPAQPFDTILTMNLTRGARFGDERPSSKTSL